jgi:hypothetical protein
MAMSMWTGVPRRESMFRILMYGLFFTFTESLYFSRIQIHVISKSKMHVMYKEKRKNPLIGKAVPCS